MTYNTRQIFPPWLAQSLDCHVCESLGQQLKASSTGIVYRGFFWNCAIFIRIISLPSTGTRSPKPRVFETAHVWMSPSDSKLCGFKNMCRRGLKSEAIALGLQGTSKVYWQKKKDISNPRVVNLVGGRGRGWQKKYLKTKVIIYVKTLKITV